MGHPADSGTALDSTQEPELDFEGDVKVDSDLPTADTIAQCADQLVLDAKGASRPFKSLYEGEGVAPRQLIIFVRHFFCGNCQEFLRSLTSSITPDSLLALPTPTFITVIGCGRPELIDMYVQTTQCPYPVYADPTQKLYDLLGMTRTLDLGKQKPNYIQASFMSGVAQSIVQVVKSGRGGLKGGDLKQIGGEFLVEKGKFVWCHRMRNTRDHSEIPELRRVLQMEEGKPLLRKRWSTSIKGIARRSRSWSRTRNDGHVDERPAHGDQTAEKAKKKASRVEKKDGEGKGDEQKLLHGDLEPAVTGASTT